jgi:hypothetical protein
MRIRAVRARKCVRAPQRSLLLLVVIPFTLLALLVTASYVARSRFVLGPLLRARVVQEASARGVDLYIGDVDPAGLFGVRFEQVRARLLRVYGTGARPRPVDPALAIANRFGKLAQA